MSTTANTINLLGKEYPVRFGIKFQRIFMDRQGITKIADYQKRLALLGKMDGMDGFEVLSDFIFCAVQAASDKAIKIDMDDVLDDIMLNNAPVLQDLMVIFEKSQPKAVGKSNKAK